MRIMAKFRYEAINEAGTIQTGVLEGLTSRSVEEILRGMGYYPQKVSRLFEKEKKGTIEFSYKIPIRDLSIFCNQLSVILKAGVSILQSLEIMTSQTENKKLRAVIKDVYERIQKGESVSNAFREHAKRFPELFLSMLEAGEVSGNMDAALARMGTTLSKNYKLAQKARNSMIYPTVLVVVSLLVVTFLLIFVVPTFTGLYASSGRDLPALTRFMIGLGDFMSHNFLVLFLIIAALIVTIRLMLKTENIRYSFDRMKLHLPVFGKLLLKIITSRYTQNMSSLISSGIPLTQALDITSRSVGNAYVSKGILSIITEVRSGNGLAGPLRDLNIFSPMVVQMTMLGEESGTLDDLLNQTADFYEAEADNATTKITALMEPLIILFLGGMVLTIVLSVVLPMFGMYSMIAS